MPSFNEFMIQSPPSQKPVPCSPVSSLDNSLPPPDLSLQLAVRDRDKFFNRPDSSQATVPRGSLQIADRRPVPQMQFNDTTRHQPEYYRLHDSNSPDPGQRTVLGLLDDNSTAKTSSDISVIMEGNELHLFKCSYEACVEARYDAQIKHLADSLQQAVVERDAKIISIAHRNLMAEQDAMDHRL